jgi:hypothetical protein
MLGLDQIVRAEAGRVGLVEPPAGRFVDSGQRHGLGQQRVDRLGALAQAPRPRLLGQELAHRQRLGRKALGRGRRRRRMVLPLGEHRRVGDLDRVDANAHADLRRATRPRPASRRRTTW